MNLFHTLRRGFSSITLAIVLSVALLPGFSINHASASKFGSLEYAQNTVRVVNALIYLDTIQYTFDLLGTGYTFLPPQVSELCRAVRSAANRQVTVDCENDEALAKPYSIDLPIAGATGSVDLEWTYDSSNYPDDANSSGSMALDIEGTDSVDGTVVDEGAGDVDIIGDTGAPDSVSVTAPSQPLDIPRWAYFIGILILVILLYLAWSRNRR